MPHDFRSLPHHIADRSCVLVLFLRTKKHFLVYVQFNNICDASTARFWKYRQQFWSKVINIRLLASMLWIFSKICRSIPLSIENGAFT